MRSKQLLLPAVATLLVVLMGGCKKNMDNNISSSNISNLSSAKAPKSTPLVVVPLGAAGSFVILSKSGITNVPTSAITGDIGVSPATGASITPGVTCDQVTGKIYTVDAAGPACRVINPTKLTAAVSAMQTAYTNAAGRPTSLGLLDLGAGTIGSTTPPLTPGVYTWGTGLHITGGITLSGSSKDVWILQVAHTLTVDDAVIVTLSGGALAKNIFWQVAETVALGSTSHFEGIILGQTDITLTSGASINGRLLAQTDVTLIQNTVTQPSK